MPTFSGTVEAVSVKPLDTPDQYENTHRQSVKIGNDWYGFGTAKAGEPGTIHIKAGNITKGTKIEGLYDQSGNFKNVKRASVSIIGQAPVQQTVTKSATQPKASTGYSNVGVAVGAAVNQAVQLHNHKFKVGTDIDYDWIEKCAVQMYKLAEGLKHQAEKGDIESAVVDKSAPEPLDDDTDDDIPF